MQRIGKQLLLDGFENRIEAHLNIITNSFQNLDTAGLLRPAANGGWSIAQCLEHLNSYGRYYLPAIQKQIKAAGDTTAPVFRSSWLGSYFTRLMEPGAKMKTMKAPKGHVPAADLDPAIVMATFVDQQETLLSLVRASALKDLNHIRIPISIAQWIRLKLGDVFGFLIAHNERHIQQALRNLK